MPVKYRRLSKNKINKILRCFSADLSATQTAQVTDVNRNTINVWYMTFRKALAEFQEEQVAQSSGSFELDESYFGGVKKRLTQKNEENEVEVQKIRFPSLALRNEMTELFIQKL